MSSAAARVVGPIDVSRSRRRPTGRRWSGNSSVCSSTCRRRSPRRHRCLGTRPTGRSSHPTESGSRCRACRRCCSSRHRSPSVHTDPVRVACTSPCLRTRSTRRRPRIEFRRRGCRGQPRRRSVRPSRRSRGSSCIRRGNDCCPRSETECRRSRVPRSKPQTTRSRRARSTLFATTSRTDLTRSVRVESSNGR